MEGKPDTGTEHLKTWIGRTESREDIITPWPVRGLSATFDLPEPDLSAWGGVPLGWHWLYFLEAKRASELGPDGHPKRGGFLPPVSLPRRMWAGGRIEFRRPLRIGETTRRKSEILSVEPKSGRTGEMVFPATHAYAVNGAEAGYGKIARCGPRTATGRMTAAA